MKKDSNSFEKYWQDRVEQRTLFVEKSSNELLQNMKTLYKNCVSEVTKEIEAFYGRYAKDNNLSLSDVNKRLRPSELKTAKEEMELYYDRINKIARNKKGKVDVKLLLKYKDELRLQHAKMYLSRLEELKIQLKNKVFELGIKESELYSDALYKTYEQSYKTLNFDMDKFLGFSTGFSGLDYEKINTAIKQNWLESNFSDRIWKNKSKLLNQLNTTFLQGVARNQNPVTIAQTMSKNIGVSYSNCERLCRTEMAHIQTEATLQGYKDRGVEKYKFDATLDNRTSEICKSLDGKVFLLKEAQVGINYPPMHANCRSATTPYFEPDEIDSKFEESKRVARKNGKLYEVPASMSYKEWEKTIAQN